jgi:hypothetical protein
MKSAFYTVAFLNVVTLGFSGYLLLAPVSGLRLVSAPVPNTQSSDNISKSSALLDTAPQTGPDSPQLLAADQSKAAPAANPLSVTGVTSIISEPIQPSSSSGSISSFPQDDPPRSSAFRLNDYPSVSAITEPPTPQRSTGHDSVSYGVAADALSKPVAVKASAAPAVNNAPAVVSIPFAYTTSPEGATPDQKAALNRLQTNFAGAVTSQNQSPNNPDYANTWQAAQAQSDATYAQDFGWQAFVQQQIQQVQAGNQ